VKTVRSAGPRTSDRLLNAIDDLKATERLKRQEPISTPRFLELAEQVTHKANEVSREATQQERQGDQMSAPRSDSIEEVPPERPN
jgi:hypothetical protein